MNSKLHLRTLSYPILSDECCILEEIQPSVKNCTFYKCVKNGRRNIYIKLGVVLSYIVDKENSEFIITFISIRNHTYDGGSVKICRSDDEIFGIILEDEELRSKRIFTYSTIIYSKIPGLSIAVQKSSRFSGDVYIRDLLVGEVLFAQKCDKDKVAIVIECDRYCHYEGCSVEYNNCDFKIILL